MDAGIALAHKLTGQQYDAETLKPYHYLTSQNVNYDIVPKNKMGFWIKYNNMMELYIADNFFLHDFLSAFIETCDKHNYDFRDFIASFLIDDKGKATLIESGSTTPPAAQTKPMGFTVEPIPETTRSAEIADYIQRLSKLYGHCMNAAANIPTSVELNSGQVKDIATSLFIHTTKHFNI